MPSRNRTLRQSMDEFCHALGGEDSELLLDSVMAGCAIIACADGAVAPEERKRVLGLIRRFEPLRVFGGGDLVDSFEKAASALEHDRGEGERRALTVIGRLRDRPRYAAMLLQACQAIASADGAFGDGERNAMIRICGSLGLDPAGHGLTNAF